MGRRRPAPLKYVAKRLLIRPQSATLADMLGRIGRLTVIVSTVALIALWYATTLGPILPGHPLAGPVSPLALELSRYGPVFMPRGLGCVAPHRNRGHARFSGGNLAICLLNCDASSSPCQLALNREIDS